MSYVVAVCDPCQSVTLAGAPGFKSPLRACEVCQEPLRLVPGRLYHHNERTIFHLLSAAIGAGSLSSLEAHQLSRVVAAALVDRTFFGCWERLSRRLPALISWEQVLGSNVRAHEDVLQLVRAILEALSTCRRSGVLPTNQPAVEPRTKVPKDG